MKKFLFFLLMSLLVFTNIIVAQPPNMYNSQWKVDKVEVVDGIISQTQLQDDDNMMLSFSPKGGEVNFVMIVKMKPSSISSIQLYKEVTEWMGSDDGDYWTRYYRTEDDMFVSIMVIESNKIVFKVSKDDQSFIYTGRFWRYL